MGFKEDLKDAGLKGAGDVEDMDKAVAFVLKVRAAEESTEIKQREEAERAQAEHDRHMDAMQREAYEREMRERGISLEHAPYQPAPQRLFAKGMTFLREADKILDNVRSERKALEWELEEALRKAYMSRIEKQATPIDAFRALGMRDAFNGEPDSDLAMLQVRLNDLRQLLHDNDRNNRG